VKRLDHYLFLCLIIFVLTGCSQGDYKRHASNIKSITASIAGTVIIETIRLAKFLGQDGIVTQIADNKITIACHHHFAEPLPVDTLD